MKEMKIRYKNSETEVIFKRGVIKEISSFLPNYKKILIISQCEVPKKFRQELMNQFSQAYLFLVPTSEKAKSIDTYVECLTYLQKQEFTRDDIIIALGGGTVGDLAGFVAATYLRGIQWIQVPTTTLSQIDSSVGGKSALNLNGVKNVVGAFWQPQKVFVDTETLLTLDYRNFNNGLIEALKVGLLFDEVLVNKIENFNPDELEDIIISAVDLKRQVVEQDECDHGIRAVLNFGHTLGHAIESLSNGQFLHGECVGIGLLAMIESKELRDRVRGILKKMDSPISFEGELQEVIQIIQHDKKRQKDQIAAILLDCIGSWRIEKLEWKEVEGKVRRVIDEKHIGK